MDSLDGSGRWFGVVLGDTDGAVAPDHQSGRSYLLIDQLPGSILESPSSWNTLVSDAMITHFYTDYTDSGMLHLACSSLTPAALRYQIHVHIHHIRATRG